MDDSLQSEHCAQYLKALAEPDRLLIISCLRRGPQNVGAIAELVGRPPVNVSHHLGILRRVGLVVTRRDGKYVNYMLNQSLFPEGANRLELGCCRLELRAMK